jgi:hypothetical protein
MTGVCSTFARTVGLVNDDDTFSPELRAKLDEAGASSLASLTRAQAADVVAFIVTR